MPYSTCARRAGAWVLAVSIFVVFMGSARAQTDERYPSRPVKLIIGVPPGGPTDLVGRLIATRLGEVLGQQLVVENRAGASGALGMEAVAHAAPDGYTLAYGASSNVAQLPALRRNVAFNPLEDFAPISMTVTGTFTLVTTVSVPATTMAEFIAYGRAHPNTLNFATAGAGSAPHLAAVLFNEQAGIQAVHVPFTGGGPALQATMQGNTHYVFDTVATSVPLLKSTKVRVLAVTSAEPSPSLPGVPTASAAGLPGLVITTWNGLLAPRGTPGPIVERLNKALRTALGSHDFSERLSSMGLAAAPTSPEAFSAFIARELERWRGVVERSGVSAE